jgi:hypothetical protein
MREIYLIGWYRGFLIGLLIGSIIGGVMGFAACAGWINWDHLLKVNDELLYLHKEMYNLLPGGK